MADIVWRPYQVDCKKAIKENYDQGIKKQLIVQATGTGKRLAAVNLMHYFKRSLFIAHREELIMQAYDEINKFYPMNVGIIKGRIFEADKKVVVASVQTLYNRLDKIDPNSFDLVIIDECFPAGTKVDGVNIENFVAGCIVRTFNHETNKIEWRKITRVMKRKYSSKLYDFGQFKCTTNHPIFINEIGYCLASEIYFSYICSKVMCYEIQARFTNNVLFKLWERIWSWRIWNKSEGIHAFSPTRVKMLFRKMQEGIFQESLISNNEQDKQEVLFREDEEKQSNVETGNCRESKSKTNGEDISKQRRQWKINKTSDDYSRVNETSDGISNISKKSNVIRKVYASFKMLQSRLSMSGSKISDRNRRKISPIKALEILRQTENGHIEKSRLDYIKIYKPTSRQKATEDCKENYVYNLEVEGNNNYFANSVLVHNCHHYISRTFLSTARHWNPKLLTGWTATPKRLDGLSLTNLFEKLVFEYNIHDGIKDGYLAPIEAYQIKSQSDISKVKRTAGDFNQKELSEAVDCALRNNLIVQKYKQYTPGRPAIAYCVDIEHAYHLRDEFRTNGITCEAVSSDESRGDDRTETVKKFRNKEFTVLTNCEILTEGFDFNDVGCVIMARPTQSETLYVQCIGRATRLKSQAYVEEFKTDKATILDFVDNTGKLNLINAYELEKGIPIEDRMFLPAENKEKLLLEEKKRRERRIKLEEGHDRKIDLLRLPEVKVFDSEKMLEPATEKQLDWIKRAGVYVEGVEYNKLQASELISNLPCNSWQIEFLAINGYDVSKGAVMGQYQRVKYAIEQRQKYSIDSKTKSKVKETWGTFTK